MRSKPKRQQPADIISRDEYAMLIDAFPQRGYHDLRARAVLALMYYAGLRREEVVKLTRERTILTGDYPRIEIRDSKYGAGRNIPLDQRLREPLEAWLNEAPRSRWLICTYRKPGVEDNPISKGNPPGSQATVMSVWAHVRTARRRSGITRRIHPHLFRHTAATNWLNAKLDDGDRLTIRDVQYLLGHQNTHTTQRYLHVHDQDIARKVYRMGTPTTSIAARPLPASQPTPALRDCPYCAEPVKLAAILCRWCRSEIAA